MPTDPEPRNKPDNRSRDHSARPRSLELDPFATKPEIDEDAEDPELNWEQPPSPPGYRKAFLLLIILVSTFGTSFLLISHVGRNKTPAPLVPLRPSTPGTYMQRHSAAEVRASTEKAVRGFMNASTDAERCKFILGGAQLETQIREFYQRPEAQAPLGFGSLLDVRHAAFAGIPIQAAVASEPNQLVTHSFVLLPLPDRMIIDWEASVAYGELSWADFLGNTPTQPTAMRVYLKRASADPDHPDLTFYQVSSRGHEGAFRASLRTDSPLADELARVVPPGASQPVHIRLLWRSTPPEPPAAELVELLHNFWIDPTSLDQHQ